MNATTRLLKKNKDIAIIVLFGAVAIMATLFFGGCAATIPPGPVFEQSSDAGVTKLINQPPNTIGIREVDLNWAATGASNTKAVKAGKDGVYQVGSGPSTTQLFFDPKSSTVSFSSETDFSADSIAMYGPEGKPLYAVMNFKANASDPTKAIATPMAVWMEGFMALSEDQKNLVIARIQAEAENMKTISSAGAQVLTDLIKALVPPLAAVPPQ